MSRGLKWFVGLIAGILVAISVLLYLVRSQDGPAEILSGGPFRSGELVAIPADRAFLDEFKTIEMQTMLPPRSRTMWLVVHENRLFVISSYMNTHIGRAWKQWPRKVARDNRAIIRAAGKLYELKLERHLEGDHIEAVLHRFNAKYGANLTPADIENRSTWLFELSDR